MAYQPPPQRQFDPVTFQSPYDCVPTCCAIAVDRTTVGAKVVNHVTIRNASGVTGRGLSYEEGVAATRKATGIVGQVRYGISAADLKALLVAGHAVTVSIDTHATANTPYATNHFLGYHSVYGNVYYSSNDTVNVKDPGTSASYLNWPFALLVKAAVLRSQGHGINVIVWPDTEGVLRTGVGDSLRVAPSLTAASKGPVKKGRKYLVTSTFNGGAWQRADGSGTSHGWHRVPGNLFTTGKGLQ